MADEVAALKELIHELGFAIGEAVGGLQVSPGGDLVTLGSTNHRDHLLEAYNSYEDWRMGETDIEEDIDDE